MTEKSTSQKETKETKPLYLDFFIPFETPVPGANTKTWTDPETGVEHEYEHGGIRVLSNPQAMKLLARVEQELRMSRNIPNDPDKEISQGHPLYLIAVKRGDENPSFTAAEYLKEEKRNISSLAYFFALTALTKLDRVPTPYESDEDRRQTLLKNIVMNDDYEPGKLTTEEFQIYEQWGRAIDEFPPPDLNLKNPFEARLKVLQDVIGDQPYTFLVKFNRAMKEAMDNLLRLVLVEVDEDGFRLRTPDQSVSVQPRTASGNTGQGSGNPESEEDSGTDLPSV